MDRCLRQWTGWGILLLLIGAGDVSLTQEPAEELRLQATSTTRRFLSRGHLYAENVRMVGWAEDIAARVEERLGRPLPIREGEPIWFVMLFNDKEPASIVRQQKVIGDRLVQRILINLPDEVRQEDLLEAFVTTLVNRYVNSHGSILRKEREPAETPEWFSVGLAQALLTELYQRNRALHIARWHQHKDDRPERLLDIKLFPPGPRIEKAACALLFTWLETNSEFSVVLPQLLVRIRSGQEIDRNWLVQVMNRYGHVDDIERHWDAFLTRSAARRQGWDIALGEQLERLKGMIRFRAIQFGVEAPPPFNQQELLLQQLPALPRDEWFQVLVLNLNLQIRTLGMGQPIGFQNVANQFASYLGDLLEKSPGADVKRPPSEAKIRLQRARFDSAWQSLQRYEKTLKESKSMEVFEKEIRKEFPSIDKEAEAKPPARALSEEEQMAEFLRRMRENKKLNAQRKNP